MKDASRRLRLVCRFNPNDGLYESISDGSIYYIEKRTFVEGKASEEQLKLYAYECYQHKLMQAAKEVPVPPRPTSPEKVCCATCFAEITEGSFSLGKNTKLFFCNNCSATSSQPCIEDPAVRMLLAVGKATLITLALCLFIGAVKLATTAPF